MITQEQYRKLLEERKQGVCINISAMRSGMSEKTARKYVHGGKGPEEMKKKRNWRTRQDPFFQDWETIKWMLEGNNGLETKTVFEYLNREEHRNYQAGQLHVTAEVQVMAGHRGTG